ncbi:MAG: hypothetical protein MUP99_01665, partial [Pedobacter sp.]|nr:hypothetical protein [Pedobacter sp.]
MNRFFQILLIACVLSAVFHHHAIAQQPVRIVDQQPHHFISFAEMEYLEDKTNKLTFNDILRSDVHFKVNKKHIPKNFNTSSSYWYRFK